MRISRRSFLGGLAASFAMPGWMKRIASWFAPEVKVIKSVTLTSSATRVFVPTFEIVSMPMISLKEVKERRFQIYDRYQRVAKTDTD